MPSLDKNGLLVFPPPLWHPGIHDPVFSPGNIFYPSRREPFNKLNIWILLAQFLILAGFDTKIVSLTVTWMVINQLLVYSKWIITHIFPVKTFKQHGAFFLLAYK